MIDEVPPLLISGSGWPVTGAKPTATHILNNACVTKSMASPMAKKAGKLFSHRLAMRPVRKSRMIYSMATKMAPASPNSSMMIA